MEGFTVLVESSTTNSRKQDEAFRLLSIIVMTFRSDRRCIDFTQHEELQRNFEDTTWTCSEIMLTVVQYSYVAELRKIRLIALSRPINSFFHKHLLWLYDR